MRDRRGAYRVLMRRPMCRWEDILKGFSRSRMRRHGLD